MTLWTRWVDWLDACRGDPAADVSYLLLQLHAAKIALGYLDAYLSLANIDRSRVLRWLPNGAAAKLAEGVPGERAGLLKIVGLSSALVPSSRQRALAPEVRQWVKRTVPPVTKHR